LAHKEHGRLPVAVGGDGDFMRAPGARWTVAYHQIPLLYVVHNNGGYHQERMKIQEQCNERGRGLTRGTTGCDLPSIDYSKIAQGLGIDARHSVAGMAPAPVARCSPTRLPRRSWPEPLHEKIDQRAHAR
jgi:acetolactate synthase-1/2/3 large subunit